ncbi:DUF5131 family protein [Paraburkholderia sp. SIMBA_054]|uniref:DUF5131 family protein n=1 Tax=Paraburkholderia sp. SIMBA_054 TaxID=3085795 RepID=UPI0039780785
MANQSQIEWTQLTWNPTTGCTKVSPGCKNCYAEPMAARLKAMKAPGYDEGFKLTLQPLRLTQPLERRKSSVYFVNSMSDLFHHDIPDAYLDRVFDTIARSPQHTFQILTKRADRLPEYFASRKCPQNVWLGVSVEDQKYGLPRIDYLRQVDAAVRFLSVEPLLEDLGAVDLSGIHWTIVGGESGPRARPMREAWVTNLKEQADRAGAAFFFKQWGSWGPDGVRRAKKANGRLLHGRTWDAYPSTIKIAA